MSSSSSYALGDLASTVLVQVTERGTPVDVTGATVTLAMTLPDRTTATWSATVLAAGTYTYGNLTLTTGGTEGWVRYTTSAAAPGDWTQAGEWKGRVAVAGLGAWSGKSLDSFAFLVAP
jgi:hypothetical protein